MVINRDKHNKFFTIGGSTGSQDTNDSQNQPSGDNNSNTGSSTGSTGGSTTIIYQGGGMTENQSNKLNGIEEGAEKNQDAFSYITIQGATSEEDVTLSADDPTDTFKLAAKDSITLSLEDDVITIGCHGTKYLKELLDVDAQNPLDEDLLIYNSETEKWEAINPQFATIEWVNEQFDKIIGSAPEVLDTIYEIAEALGNDPDYVKDIANNLSALTNRVTVTEQDVIDIKGKLLPTNFTDLTSGQLLQYDGQYWVNVNKSSSEIDENWLLEYLTTNNYVKKSDITWSNLIGKPSTYATDIANITDLNSGWDSLLANAPTAHITRWPNFSEIGSKPSTLVGYGITDGVNSITTSGTGNVITGATISGHVLTLSKGITAITSVSLATINDLHANWDAILKVAPTAYVTRWPSWDEVTDKPATADVVTGNAGSSTVGVYVSNNEVKAMSYSLAAHVSTGITGRLAYYMGGTNLTNYSATVGSQSKPIDINQGVPAACTEFNAIPHYGKYYLNSREATYSTVIDNYAFIRSIVRQAEGQLLITVNIPVSVRELSQIFVWGVGRYTHIDTSADGGCYVSIYIINSTQMRVTVHNDASANDGYFYLHFLTIG